MSNNSIDQSTAFICEWLFSEKSLYKSAQPRHASRKKEFPLDAKLEQQLHALVKSDIIEQGATNFDYSIIHWH